MRIIAGEFRSRTLVVPQGKATRPTMDRARESLFNVLANVMSFEGISVLDLYAGSGALAFEALSRGAALATLIDKSPNALRAIEKNAQALGVEGRVTILRQNVNDLLAQRPQGQEFDLILADPPYDLIDGTELANSILQNGWLTPRGICVIEHRAGTSLVHVEGAQVIRELKAGESRFTILTRTTA